MISISGILLSDVKCERERTDSLWIIEEHSRSIDSSSADCCILTDRPVGGEGLMVAGSGPIQGYRLGRVDKVISDPGEKQFGGN